VNADERLLVVSRRAPAARQGKGDALNAGYLVLAEHVRSRGIDPSMVVVGVMDGDGHLSLGAIQACLPLFDDERVGGVQLSVRIRDRRRLIAQFQDVEFWMISALSQFARSTTGTVSLGGNGQFTRLVALQALDGGPWSDSLTEDLDLGLRLIAGGWRITTTTRGYVSQQAVDTYRRLLRQRTRWYQGHMTCLGRLPKLWSAYRDVNQVALMEVTSYLLVPWLIVLPWSILQQWIFYQLAVRSGRGILATDVGPLKWRIGYLVMFYLISFLPNLLIGITYSRRTRAVSIGRALLLAHLMIIWNYVGYVATWRALGRMIRGRRGWVKTTRALEPDAGLIVPTPAPVLAVSPPGSKGT
jgi:1,2-diacylglycerol 3-beta-glucosyltransferase